MASAKTTMPTLPPDTLAEPPYCPLCAAPMACIGELPKIIARPWVEVFRCTCCTHVLTRER